MPTVRINTYDQNTGPQGAALPQANIPGNFQIEANAARQYGMLADRLRGLAGVELRMRDAKRADQLNAATANYMNDIMREQERLGNEDTDYETQRNRYVQFQQERAKFYGSQLGDDLRSDFDTAILLPSTEHEFQVGQSAMAWLNDRIISNVNQRITDLTSQSGFDRARDDESLRMIEQELATLFNNKVIGQDKAREILEHSKQTMQLNQLGVMAETDPQAIIAATQGFRVPVEGLSKEGVIGKASGDKAAIKSSIYDKAVAGGHDPRMMLGIAEAESGFNPSAKSEEDDRGSYAAGLFQFRGPAAKQVGLINADGDHRLNAEANMNGAMKYMDYIASVVPGGRSRPDLMIAAWYQGPHNKDIQAGQVPANAVNYVNKVLSYGYGEDGMKGVGASGIAQNAGALSGEAGTTGGQSAGLSGGYGSPATGISAYDNLRAQGYTTQQMLAFVPKAEAAYHANVQNNTYDMLSSMSFGTAMEALASPDFRVRMGLDADDARNVEGMLYTHYSHMNTIQTKAREQYETDIITQSTDLALGARGVSADPVKARKMIIDSSLDGYSKAKALKSIESDEVGKRDDAGYVSDLQSRIIQSRGVLPEADILQGVLDGRMTLETKDKMLKLRDQAQGPYAGSISGAYESIDEAFSRSIMMEGSPAVAQAKFEAKNELNIAIQAAMEKGNALEILDPNSPKYILPGIISRHYLTTQQQTEAGLQMMLQNQESTVQGNEAKAEEKNVAIVVKNEKTDGAAAKNEAVSKYAFPKPRGFGPTAQNLFKAERPRMRGQGIEDYDLEWAQLMSTAGYVDTLE